jgi:predicted nucleic-acid-binding Zn-ribbon protein
MTKRNWTPAATLRARREQKAIREYRRTCERCAHTWYVPRDIAQEKAPTSFDIKATRMNAATSIFGRGGKRREALMMQEKRERLAATQQCPSCGSVSYKEEALS